MLGALILTGGASARRGADKATLLWDGVRAIDSWLDIMRTAFAGNYDRLDQVLADMDSKTKERKRR